MNLLEEKQTNKQKLKKRTYIFSLTKFMTMKPESTFSFYDTHNINCLAGPLGFCLVVFSPKGRKKSVRLKGYFSLKKNQCCYNSRLVWNSCLNYRDSDCWWLSLKAMGDTCEEEGFRILPRTEISWMEIIKEVLSNICCKSPILIFFNFVLLSLPIFAGLYSRGINSGFSFVANWLRLQ